MQTVPAVLVLLSGEHGALFSYLRKPAELCRILVITTASNPTRDAGGDLSWLNESLQELREAGFAFEPYDIAGKTYEEVSTVMHECDVVYVAGGNTFYLLQEVRASGFDRALDEFLQDREHVYVGASAGTALMCPDIDYASPMDDPADAPQLESTVGLGYVDVPIMPHVVFDDAGNIADELVEACIRKAISNGPAPVLITDEQAVIVKDGQRRIMRSPRMGTDDMSVTE